MNEEGYHLDKNMNLSDTDRKVKGFLCYSVRVVSSKSWTCLKEDIPSSYWQLCRQSSFIPLRIILLRPCFLMWFTYQWFMAIWSSYESTTAVMPWRYIDYLAPMRYWHRTLGSTVSISHKWALELCTSSVVSWVIEWQFPQKCSMVLMQKYP